MMPFLLLLTPLPPPAPLPASSLSLPSPKLPFTSSLHLRNNHRRNKLLPALLSSSSSVTPPPDASSAEVPLFLGPDGIYSICRPTSGTRNPSDRVVVLWDLDNKPPRGPPYDAALSLRRLASSIGTLLHASAFANRHAFLHVPQRVLQGRRDCRLRDQLERLRPPSDPYSCSLCGRRFPTHLALRRHFRSLHERERNKKLARLHSLKGKRRQRYRERYISGNTRYEEAARELGPRPRQGYGLAGELRRAGVSVRTVKDRPQAADAALREEMGQWVAKGVEWLFLVSDDSDFADAVRWARESETRTVVVGDWRAPLGRHADVWVPWARVENGEVGEEVVRAGGWKGGDGIGSVFGGGGGGYGEDGGGGGYGEEVELGSELDVAIDEIVRQQSGYGQSGFRSAFSEEEDKIRGHRDDGELLWDSEEEDDDEL